jgi:hypothetical protein
MSAQVPTVLNGFATQVVIGLLQEVSVTVCKLFWQEVLGNDNLLDRALHSY